jgi:hypothetical protein
MRRPFSLNRRCIQTPCPILRNQFPKAITITKGYGLKDCHALDVDQLYKVTYGALRKVIADNENLVEKIHTLEERIMTLENAS